MSAVITYFNSIAKAYRQDAELHSFQQMNALGTIVDFIEKSSQSKHLSFLEIGCGPGYLLQAFKMAHRDWHVVGIDGSTEMIERCKKKSKITGENLRLIDLENGKIPFDDNSFDIVVSYATLLYVRKAPNIASEMLRVAKPRAHVAYDCYLHNDRDIAVAEYKRSIEFGDSSLLRIFYSHNAERMFNIASQHLYRLHQSPPMQTSLREINPATFIIQKG